MHDVSALKSPFGENILEAFWFLSWVCATQTLTCLTPEWNPADVLCGNHCRRRERKSFFFFFLKGETRNLWNAFLRAKQHVLPLFLTAAARGVVAHHAVGSVDALPLFWLCESQPHFGSGIITLEFAQSESAHLLRLSESLSTQVTFRQLLTFSLPFWMASRKSALHVIFQDAPKLLYPLPSYCTKPFFFYGLVHTESV